MEDPICFDIWVKIERGHTAEAVAWVADLRPLLSALEVRKLINDATMRGEWALVAQSVGWSRVSELRATKPAWSGEMRVCQEMYRPDAPLGPFYNYCKRHQLYFGGCLGCHVCSGFVVR